MRTFPPDGKETEAEQYAIEVSTMHSNILLFSSCVLVCASPSPLALSASLRLPPELSPSPFAHGQPLLFSASSCSFTDACSFLWVRESELVSTANTGREAGAQCGWCHQNAASVPWLWFSNAYACQSCYCAASPLAYPNDTSCKLHSNTDASSLTAAGGRGRKGWEDSREKEEERKNWYTTSSITSSQISAPNNKNKRLLRLFVPYYHLQNKLPCCVTALKDWFPHQISHQFIISNDCMVVIKANLFIKIAVHTLQSHKHYITALFKATKRSTTLNDTQSHYTLH